MVPGRSVRFVARRATVLAVTYPETAAGARPPPGVPDRHADPSPRTWIPTRRGSGSAAGPASGSCWCSAGRRPSAGSTTRSRAPCRGWSSGCAWSTSPATTATRAAVAARDALPAGLRDRYRPFPFLHEEMTGGARRRRPGRRPGRLVHAGRGCRVRAADGDRPVPARRRATSGATPSRTPPAGAAVLIDDDAFDADRLVEVAGLLADPAAHARMSAAARDAARPHAAAAVADLVLAVARRAAAARRRRTSTPSRAGPPGDGAGPGLRRDGGRRRYRPPRRRPHRRRRAAGHGSRRCGWAARPTCSRSRTTRSSCAGWSGSRAPGGSRTSLLGRGSDLVVSDAGIRGLVIHVKAEGVRVDGRPLPRRRRRPDGTRRHRDPARRA